jgi:hypothetical protein
MHASWLCVCQYPALQRHWEMLALPAFECECKGQSTHDVLATAPSAEP